MIHIALTIDRRFTRFCAVTMVSIMKNNMKQKVKFHIIDDCSLSATDKDVLLRTAHGFHADVAFYQVEDKLLDGFTLKWENKRLSMVVFFRCILPSILPSSLSRVLYLDCDVLVLGDLNELWNTDLDGYALAAVPDSIVGHPKRCERLHYDSSYNYFNGGVLLLNLDYWRKYDIEKKCKIYYQENFNRIIYNDQDLLNGLLYDKKRLVDMKWNVQEGAYRKKAAHLYPKCLVAEPMILHYSSRKPWQYHCMHPLRNLFFEYQELTAWKGCNPLTSWTARLHRFVHLLPYSLGLKNNKYIEIKKQHP